MAQGRSTEIISMIEWIRTNRLSMKNSLPGWQVCIKGGVSDNRFLQEGSFGQPDTHM